MDSAAFPHIMDMIVVAAANDYAFGHYTPPRRRDPEKLYPDNCPTPLALRATCRTLRDKFDAALAKHLAWNNRSADEVISTPNLRRLPMQYKPDVGSYSSCTPGTHRQRSLDAKNGGIWRLAHLTRILDLNGRWIELWSDDTRFHNLEMVRVSEDTWTNLSAPTVVKRIADDREGWNTIYIGCPYGVKRFVIRMPVFRPLESPGSTEIDDADGGPDEYELVDLPPYTLEELVILLDWPSSLRKTLPWQVPTPDELATQHSILIPEAYHSAIFDIYPVCRLFGAFRPRYSDPVPSEWALFVGRGGRVTIVDRAANDWELERRTIAAHCLCEAADLPPDLRASVNYISWDDWRATAPYLERDWLDK